MSAPVSPLTLSACVRALAMDAVQRANSGHPGMPMGMADLAVTLWTKHLRHDPADPSWPGRDRFILSNGHGSMLLYALLHLTGYDLPMAELRDFRQLGSRTPGHPERGVTPGVETTTGPLGQGIANAVGMALAEKALAAEFNRDGFDIIDNRVYCFLGDGCMMEGISHEACSLAGVWRLNKLIAIYDDNGISIDGPVSGWFADDTRKRFEAYGWNVIGPIDGHDHAVIDAALSAAEAERERPSLIIAKTVIGRGAPHRQGSAKAHGEALGEEEVAAARACLGWDHPPFEVPAEVYEAMDARAAGQAREEEWKRRFAAYAERYPELAAELTRRLAGELPRNFDETVFEALCRAQEEAASVATRKASQAALSALAPVLPELLGGSADLTGSNLTRWAGAETLTADRPLGRHISYGVREFAMAAIQNGVALYGGFIPFCATFLTFSDYARNALRMAALMGLRSIFVFTHDSIGVGEDGPTHQPVEHLASLRLIPGLDVWRPADTVESLLAWAAAIERRDGPSALIFSRQTVAFPERDEVDADAIARGAYVLAEAPAGADKAEIIIAATGSELPLALAARKQLTAANVQARVVSVPCADVFDRQPAAYRRAVFTPGLPLLIIEAGATGLWRKYLTGPGAVIGIDRFGESAPAAELWPRFGFSVERVTGEALRLLGR